MHIVYGTQYYRPPEPDADAWTADLARMRQTGIELVKIWAMWGWMEPTRGRYVFDEFDALFDLAAGQGMKVLPNLILECAPWWAQERFPDGSWMSADGHRPRLQIRSNSPAGGWPGLCLNHEGVRQSAEAFVREVVQRYRVHPALWGWDVWNEPSIEPAREPDWGLAERALFCYCPSTVAAYRAWLGRRYETIDRLNTAWGRRYTDWSQVEPPRQTKTGYTDWIAWRLFAAANVADLLRWRAQVVRSLDPDHPAISHAGWPTIIQREPALRGADDWQMAVSVDLWGMSAYPLGPERWRDCELDLALDWTRRCGRSRPFWLAEIQAGPHVKGPRAREPAPEELQQWGWRAVFAGASGIVYWQWRSQLSGYESPGYGLCAADGSPTDRTAAAARLARTLKSIEMRPENHAAQAEVAVLFNYEGYLHDWCRAGTNTLTRLSLLGAYEALWRKNIAVDPVSIEELEAGALTPYKVLILPSPFIIWHRAAQRLAEYVERGGTVISEPNLAAWSDDAWASPVVPGQGLSAVFGVRERRIDPQDGWHMRIARPLAMELAGTGLRAHLDVADGATIAGVFENGLAAMTEHRYGRGRTWYIAAMIMSRIAEGDRAASDLLVALVAQAGVTSTVETTDDVHARLWAGAHSVLLLIWGTPQPSVTVDLGLPNLEGTATVLETPEPLTVDRVDGRLRLEVPFVRGLAVVELQ